jgi:hypothetical protein
MRSNCVRGPYYLYGNLSSISASIEGSLPENTARWQASLRSKSPDRILPTGAPSAAIIKQTVVSFGLPALCDVGLDFA